MILAELFTTGPAKRKTVWRKRGETITREQVVLRTPTDIVPRTQVAPAAKDTKRSHHGR